jgi:alpha-tubulin suppressor-like RCC1 family protein
MVINRYRDCNNERGENMKTFRLWRGILFLLLAAALTLGLTPATAYAADSVKLGQPTTTFSGDNLFACAIKADGRLMAWGFLGSRKVDGVWEEIITTTPVKIMDDAVYVTVDGKRAAAIKTDGSLWMWGYFNGGQLGKGLDIREVSHEAPEKVMDDAAAVDFGGDHVKVIKKDGSLWSWGKNIATTFDEKGMVGDGTSTDRFTPVKIMDGVKSVSAGSYHSAAIKTDGSLWVWGGNMDGQLGDGTNTDRLSPVKIMDGVAAVSCGESHTAAVKTDGSLWTWGYNQYGQLGNGSTVNSRSPKKVMDGVASVSAAYTTMAVKTDGSLWGFGSGHLGNGQKSGVIHSVPVKTGEGYTAVCARGSNTYALKADGKLYACGTNRVGPIVTSVLRIDSRDSYTKLFKILDDVMLPS